MSVGDNGAVDLALLDSIFEKYRDQKGALIPILQHAQGVYGYLPKEVLKTIKLALVSKMM